jgi:hypothetical protein
MIEGPVRRRTLGALLLCTQSVVSCGGSNSSNHPGAPGDEPGVVEPSNASERRVLQTIETMPAGAPQRIGNLTVVAEPVYFSGSGRLCRGLTITPANGQSARHLACKQDRQWVFVPNVLITPVAPP